MTFKNYYKKNTVLFWLVYIFVLFNVIDSFTALFILPGEANPLYLWLGSIWPLIGLKLLISAGAIWLYSHNQFKSNSTYHSILSCLFIINILLALGFISNIYGMLNPQIISEGAELSNEVKVNYYVKIVSFIYLIPLFFNILTFWLYEKSVGKITYYKPKTFNEELSIVKGWFIKR